MQKPTTREDVELFLSGFRRKMAVFGVIFMDRHKNFQTLLDLEITEVKRKQILDQLAIEDFYKGPSKDRDDGPDLWEFGKVVNHKEVYIKVQMGSESRQVICISFHIAERPIRYVFK